MEQRLKERDDLRHRGMISEEEHRQARMAVLTGPPVPIVDALLQPIVDGRRAREGAVSGLAEPPATVDALLRRQAGTRLRDELPFQCDFRLSETFKFCNADSISADLEKGIKCLAEASGKGNKQKESYKLMTVVGAPGQGKTEVLLRILHNMPVRGTTKAHKLIIDTVNSGYAAAVQLCREAADAGGHGRDARGASAAQPLLPSRPTPSSEGTTVLLAAAPPQGSGRADLFADLGMTRTPVTHVMPLFVTFNAASTWMEVETGRVEAALISRLLAFATGRERLSVNDVAGFESMLHQVVNALRSSFASAKGCQASQVAVVVLVDEVRKIAEAKDRASLLDALGALQQRQLQGGMPTFVVVTCLDVASIFDVSTRSHRGLLSIKLLPCTDADIADFIEKKLANASTGTRALEHRMLLCAAHGVAGHFRSLENIFVDLTPAVISIHSNHSAQVMELWICLVNGSVGARGISDNDKFGKVLGVTDESVYELACAPGNGVFYKSADVVEGRVVPMVAPAAMNSHVGNIVNDSAMRILPPSPVRALVLRLATAFKSFYSLATAEGAVKNVEAALPYAECIVTAARQFGEKPTSVRDLYGDTVHMAAWGGSGDTVDNIMACRIDTNVNHVIVGGDQRDQTRELRRLSRDPQPLTLAMADSPTYPAIEGIWCLLQRSTSPRAAPLWTLVQTKMHAELKPSQLVSFFDAMHTHAKDFLGLSPKSYYAVIYTTASMTAATGTNPFVPCGSILVGPQALRHLIDPIGMRAPLQEFIAEKQQAGGAKRARSVAAGTDRSVASRVARVRPLQGPRSLPPVS